MQERRHITSLKLVASIQDSRNGLAATSAELEA